MSNVYLTDRVPSVTSPGPTMPIQVVYTRWLCDDLLCIRLDAYTKQHGRLLPRSRPFLPLVHLHLLVCFVNKRFSSFDMVISCSSTFNGFSPVVTFVLRAMASSSSSSESTRPIAQALHQVLERIGVAAKSTQSEVRTCYISSIKFEITRSILSLAQGETVRNVRRLFSRGATRAKCAKKGVKWSISPIVF